MMMEKIRELPAGYTVEAAGVMAVVFFTIMVLIDQSFRIRTETVGTFALHEAVEKKRHDLDQIEEQEITMATEGNNWEKEITSPVFRPEDELRAWSLLEERE